MTKRISILGSTGSIGQNALKVINHLGDGFEVKYLTAARSSEILIEQVRKFQPEAVAVVDSIAAIEVKEALSGSGVEILSGREGLLELASRDDIDVVLNGLVGSAGMEPTIRALEAGIDVALSNKESLVMAGELIENIKKETGAEIYPVDSEHSAIWQCLRGEDKSSIRRIILTGSGGPFRTRPLEEFLEITLEEALNHPNWKMGNKITIDSATMMNKGLEVIEAHWLFGTGREQIDIVIHPQSIIHSMVEFSDGSIKAQLGLPDMKLPIQYALTYPERVEADWEDAKFSDISYLTFEEPDFVKFPCIRLAYEALQRGGSAPAALNVANDNSVAAFLAGEISFTEIATLNEMALVEHDWTSQPDLDFLLELESWGKQFIDNKKETVTV
ncbi:MAG: 1-deoxy-D-xylulose-5-phosphate reductoisomerase [Candidatus Marinimicrobia bacterium]|jgi:1-deoxy-D-xylulose-5-phosphate reductoisomerase|nr:1-deoxy-D-xylulose-5-phosphate reductoisomerase [Candidatus Neomarinimicrobiota bacterium]MDP6569545.1 1-deoxy-D-xylulose-5-phosphate reductoisomerase [Candidatus Neomarinimicrobiota bacterium]MDP7026097.1 1-deoxy-D-xylulose-5-phosphate reductoisomerase [Candidatus Neomarinimicrobiota bacterium]